MACNHTYREAENLMNAYSYYSRKINNHDHIHNIVEIIGNYISEHQIEDVPDNIEHTAELICQVDGGHLKSSEDGQRSFEALTAVIYSPQNVVYAEKNITGDNSLELPRGKITSKHCAASALDDKLATIKRQTLVAALKQGMTADTKIVALCDGADNCWQVVDSLEGECNSILRILDWFHIAKKFQNIALPAKLSKKLERIKWCVWHGKSDEGISRFEEIIEKTDVEKMKIRLSQLHDYLQNNNQYLVNYAQRYKAGKAISSSVAESNVESLINTRCKGKQHMQWTREGAHPLLQVRASCASNDWIVFGAKYVLNATTWQAA